MARDVSIIFSLKDKFTNSLKNIGNEQSKFTKQAAQTSKQLELLYGKQRTLKVENKNATKALKDVQKEFNKTGVFSDDMKKKMDSALKNKYELKIQTDSASRNIKNLLKDVEKVDSKVKTTGSSGGGSMLGGVSSAISGVGGFALGGAKALLGGAAVAGGGLLAAGAYALNQSGTMEQQQIAFETLLKSKEKGDKMMNELKKFAVATPFEFADLAKNTSFALAMGFKENDVMGLLKITGDAASGLGKGADGVESIVRALGQMQAKGKVSAQEVNQLAEIGIGAWDYIAKAIGKTTAETMKLGEDGLLPADKAIQAIRKGMEKDFGGGMEKQSKTLFGLLSSIKDFVNLNLFSSFGDGIRLAILPSFQKFVDMLTNGKGGLDKIQTKLQDIGRTIGDFVINKGKSLYDFFNKLFNDELFKKADLGGKITIVLGKMMDAMTLWWNGPGGDYVKSFFNVMAKTATDTLIAALELAVVPLGKIGLDIGKEMLNGINAGLEDKLSNFVETSNPFLPTRKKEVYGPQKAMGVTRVPRDNYPIMAHEGERLLTKQEANRNSGNGVNINFSGPITVREEADIMKIAKELARQIKMTSNNMGVAY